MHLLRKFHYQPRKLLRASDSSVGQALSTSQFPAKTRSINSRKKTRKDSGLKDQIAERASAEAAASETVLAKPDAEAAESGALEARSAEPTDHSFGATESSETESAGDWVNVTEAVDVIEGILCKRFGPGLMKWAGKRGSKRKKGLEEVEEADDFVIVEEVIGSKEGRLTGVGVDGQRRQGESIDGCDDNTIANRSRSSDSSSSSSDESSSRSSSNSRTSPTTSSTIPRSRSQLGRPKRTTTHESLADLYRFFSSLGIHDPSAVAAIIASCPAFLKPEQPLPELRQKVAFLELQGVSSADIAKLVVLDAGWLRSSMAGLGGSIGFLKSAGVSGEMLGSVLLLSPRVLCLPSRTMAETVQFLKRLLGEQAAMRVLYKFPMVLTKNVRNLESKIEILGRILGAGLVNKIIERFPPVLNASAASLEDNFDKWCTVFQGVEKLPEGLRWNLGELALCSGQKAEEEVKKTKRKKLGGKGEVRMEGKVGSLGDSAARHVVCQFVTFWPYALFYNWQRNIAPKLHYLQHDLKLPITELLRYPPFLTLSLDRRIRPRHLALVKGGYVVKPHEEVLGSGRRNNDDGEPGASEKASEDGFGRMEQKGVCLSQFLPCTDATFQRRFLQAGADQGPGNKEALKVDIFWS
ncbi:hypothetical protein CLOM_g8646 [Closterium sp. NIES-68]|nr:hypothetical protein CLOM_g20888 [Closterium sp. NIES-68]GJP49441.1 hypothetical protein CLOM_g8646 [Closterium sp. NIES-68]GJP68486.1 hypothetical protein CLOP_g25188 [Closterium sp. NIES-67]